jgi:selenocysteine lyase/cysteine desulfurase
VTRAVPMRKPNNGPGTITPSPKITSHTPGGTGIVSFVVDGHDSAQVARRLADDHGIGVRDGLFCAHPPTRHLLAGHGGRAGTAVRASLGAGTTAEQVRRLVTAIRAIAAPGAGSAVGAPVVRAR